MEEVMEAKESRAKYQETWRKKNGMVQFNSIVPKENYEMLVKKLDRKNISRKEWLNKKIEEELKEN